ncbi:MAG TPA: glycosyltransferase family 87 protein [Magnetospirillum sp.]|nr:glycosyltransferase family 87 protein [Magnetospirillum sp.]
MAGIGRDRLVRWSAALLAGYAALLAVCYAQGVWFVNGDGYRETDFVNVWAAGWLALQGDAAAVYDWGIHRQAEVVALGHDFTGYFGWHYPPMLLLAAAPLAMLPYLAAWLSWSALTAAFLIWVLRRIEPDNAVVLPLMAAPATLWCVVTGQNGFLTAGLIGATLAFLDRRPVLAGIFLGLLTYKPQFGVLFPLALLAGGHWRAIASATVTALLLASASALVFGLDTWAAFVQSATATVDGVLRAGAPGWAKLQSVYALLFVWTGSELWAWGGQIATVVMLAALVAWAFRAPMPHGVRAAMLAAAAAMATPYAYVYDLTILTVAAAFLAQDGLRHGFLPGERPALACGLVLPALFGALGSAAGLSAAALVLAMSLRRALRPPRIPVVVS